MPRHLSPAVAHVVLPRSRSLFVQTPTGGAAMKTKGFLDLLELELKDIYSAEKQLTKALPKMAKAATNETLSEAFQMHLEETEGQIERLEKILKQLDISFGRVEKCK